jgi:hypothetical protein
MGRIMLAVSEGQRPDVSALPMQLQLFLGDTWAQEAKERWVQFASTPAAECFNVLASVSTCVRFCGQFVCWQIVVMVAVDSVAATRCAFGVGRRDLARRPTRSPSVNAAAGR